MNIAYLIIPLLVGVAILFPAYFMQTNLSGKVVSSTPDLDSAIVQEASESKSTCPSSCDDSNPCTTDWCNETNNYLCSHTLIDGTSEGCWGGTNSCNTNSCAAGKCITTQLARCCGDAVCDSNESCSSCSVDCGECPAPVLQTYTNTTSQSISSGGTAPSNTSQTNTTTSQTGSTTPTHIIINEFTTRGPSGASDEFVELYNPTESTISITGWKLQYKSASGTSWDSKVGSGLTGSINARSFYLLASKNYSSSSVPDYKHSANWGFADLGGHVRIIDANGFVIDKVGYGNATDPENSPALAPDDSKNLQRKSLTTDTDNNSNDFISATPSPRNSANQ